MTSPSEPEHFFAVVPDGSERPAALFRELHEAIEWGLARCGAEQFSIRGFVSGGGGATHPASADRAVELPGETALAPLGRGSLLN